MPAAGPILLVEDDRDLRDSIKEALEDEGYAVVGATDGVDAIEHLRTGGALPRLILLDLMMPRMNGYQFREAQLANPSWASIPVVVLSADPRPKAGALGATAHLRKPVKLEVLFARIGQSLRGETTSED